MEILSGKKLIEKAKPVCTNLASMEDIVKGVNAILNPNKEPINWFAPDPEARAAVHFKNGRYDESCSQTDVVCSGVITDSRAENLKVVAYKGTQGGVFAEGIGEKVILDHAFITLDGEGSGVGGPACGAAVRDAATLTVKNTCIDTHGRARFATVSETGGILKVYDSLLWSHGIAFGDTHEKPEALMSTPPDSLEIQGNTRCHCSMSNSSSFFYNSKIITDGWAALATEASEGYVYLEANDCEIVCTKSGYGAYSDPGCHDVFRRCRIDTQNMAGIIGGRSDMTFYDCTADCGSYFALFHTVNGWSEEVAELTVNGGSITTGQEVLRIKSHNADIHMSNVNVMSHSGVFLHTLKNVDPCATKAGDHPYGIHVSLNQMNIRGDILHEDPERETWLYLSSTVLTGKLEQVILSADKGSRLFLTSDCTFTLQTNLDVSQIDAPEGVLVRVVSDVEGEFELLSGGKLISIKQQD